MNFPIARVMCSIAISSLAAAIAVAGFATVATERGHRAWFDLLEATRYWHRPIVEAGGFSLLLSFVCVVVLHIVTRGTEARFRGRTELAIFGACLGGIIALIASTLIPPSAAWGFKYPLFSLVGILCGFISALTLHRNRLPPNA